MCLPTPVAAADRVTALIGDCNFQAARDVLVAMPSGDPAKAGLQSALAKASARDEAVRGLYCDAQDLARDAKAMWDSDDDGNASLAFRAARELLSSARDKTRYPDTMATLDEALAATNRNLGRSDSSVSLSMARMSIDFCMFNQAEADLTRVAPDTPGRAEVVEALRVARARRPGARPHAAAKSMHDIGKSESNAGAYTDAVETYSDARQGFLNARQLTQCSDVLAVIDEAIQVVGRNLNAAQTFVGSTPTTSTPTAGIGPDITPPGPHPCLDRAVSSQGHVNAYSMLGDGQADFALKGPFICGSNGDFTLLDDGVLTAFDCDQVGDRFENCVETRNAPITSQEAVWDGYVYRYHNDKSWIVVHPVD